jgi:hypothetical protein
MFFFTFDTYPFEPRISQIQVANVTSGLVCSFFTKTIIIIIIIIIIIGDGGGSNFFPLCTILISISLQARLENIPSLVSAMQ